MNLIKQIENDIKNNNYSPVYLFMGEEEYYIDHLTKLILNNSLQAHEKDFNLNILYGKDTLISDIISISKQYPVMSERKLVIVKEAQHLAKNDAEGNSLDDLINYVNNPLISTILVLNFKHKSLDKRKAIYKAILKNGLIFESKKLYENQAQDWVDSYLKSFEFTIDKKSSFLIVELLGTNINKIANELDKLIVLKGKNKTINQHDIEKFIGISKEFNVFELRKAIGDKDLFKCMKIIHYFSKNPKSNPVVVVISLVFDFFLKLFVYHSLSDKSDRSVASALKISPFFVKDYSSASRNYSMKDISSKISILRDYDLKSKGLGVAKISNSDILKELIFKLLH
ncbi:DNA polymerase III subunit delta [Flavobacteriaceae bacterium]|nr:DNA polymerase III subunit delta [Flavobacteriaceae bacterium]MDC1491734.1 DNA polymerase III subunit delta [Flavobacteriaceae bacterium]